MLQLSAPERACHVLVSNASRHPHSLVEDAEFRPPTNLRQAQHLLYIRSHNQSQHESRISINHAVSGVHAGYETHAIGVIEIVAEIQ